MRKIVLPLATMALVVVPTLSLSGSLPHNAETLTAKPNIIFILADDLDKASTQKIGRLRKYIGDQGATFQNAFVSESVCCPSRATILNISGSNGTT